MAGPTAAAPLVDVLVAVRFGRLGNILWQRLQGNALDSVFRTHSLSRTRLTSQITSDPFVQWTVGNYVRLKWTISIPQCFSYTYTFTHIHIYTNWDEYKCVKLKAQKYHTCNKYTNALKLHCSNFCAQCSDRATLDFCGLCMLRGNLTMKQSCQWQMYINIHAMVRNSSSDLILRNWSSIKEIIIRVALLIPAKS